ncbi:hypothetical protein [Pseudomonas rhodesiae]|uniref:hypothetical protein n=1 Tax=Pseudomonas rhodesiae TaxID=76760 RepID=UPI0028D665B1|nr:hypothetical protein [Pseudomonas rhodesiae]
MNGWQRLWAVGCALAAIALLVVGSQIQTEKKVIDSWERIKATHISELAQQETQTLEGVHSSEARAAMRELLQKSADRKMSRIDGLRDRDLLDLPAKQGEEVRRLIYIWLAWAVATYVIGWSIRWVYRGFRPTAE